MFVIYTFVLSRMKPSYLPAIPKSERSLDGWALWKKCLRGIIPSAVLIFTVLGSMGGLPFQSSAIATPTEAGAMGVVGALLLAAMSRRLTKDLIWQAMTGTMRLTAMVVFILIGSRVFSQVFQGVDGAKWVEHLLTGLPGGQVGFLIVVNIFVFFLAFFLDFFEIAFIIVPMLAPVAAKLGIDLVWFGVLLCVNLQTSFMHPPFGFALFYLRGIADTLFKDKRIPVPVKSNDIYMGAIPWVIMQIILVFVVIFVPQSVTMFLDKEIEVDLDKVQIEMPVNDVVPELELKTSEPQSAAEQLEAAAVADKASAQSTADEQKRVDDLFKK
jgi:tripartite ATP-independent transporter DctM subunit